MMSEPEVIHGHNMNFPLKKQSELPPVLMSKRPMADTTVDLQQNGNNQLTSGSLIILGLFHHGKGFCLSALTDSTWMWICLQPALCFFLRHHCWPSQCPIYHHICSAHLTVLLINVPFTAKSPSQWTYASGIYVPVTQKQLSGIRLNDIAMLNTEVHVESL